MASKDSSDFSQAISHALQRLSTPSMVLKPEQKASIKYVYEGKDVFVWLPTGYGKSVCYEALPFVFEYKLKAVAPCLALVISPLISLMVDQVLSLRRRGVKAAIITSGGGVEKELLAGDDDLSSSSLLFCAPEAIIGSRWRDEIEKPAVSSRIVAVVIDEAHCVSKWSKDFRSAYGRLHEIQALVPPNTPYLACTATATKSVREEVIDSLEMSGCEFVYTSPDRPNIFYEVRLRTDIETDLEPLLQSLRKLANRAPRVIVYCRSLNSCADLYAHFHYELGNDSYYPSDSPHLSDHRLFGMYHSNTPQYNKDVILKSLTQPDGVVRIVFATIALGMGVNLCDVNTIIHYGAPHSIDDYFQESGRGGRSGGDAHSIVYWKPIDCPIRKDLVTTRDKEVADVRRYLANTDTCRRFWLLEYFDRECARSQKTPKRCCDVCQQQRNQ